MYILDENRNPVRQEDVGIWGKWLQNDSNRRVAEAEFGAVRVSTVFLGIDHDWTREGPPILFETMVFGGPLAGEQWRCATWEEALAQHAQAVAEVKARLTRVFGPKLAGHPSVGTLCPACLVPLQEGDFTTLVALGPGDDPEARERARAGRPYNAMAVEVHAACAGLTPEAT